MAMAIGNAGSVVGDGEITYEGIFGGSDGLRSDRQPYGNGCGTTFTDPLVPDRIGSMDLLPACLAHDACYATGTTTPRSDCDAALGQAVQQACTDAGYPYIACVVIGLTYRAGVTMFGAGAYNPQPAQDDAVLRAQFDFYAY